MRHGQTSSNAFRRYLGSTDEPLSELGKAQAHEAGVVERVSRVYVSPLVRARQTAAICFPRAWQVIVDDLREMNFGAFEGRSADEMADDAEYRAWVDGECRGTCPGGEGRDAFTARIARGVEAVCADAWERGYDTAVIVGHGGTVMAAMNVLVHEDGSYFRWHVGNCGGYWLDVEPDGERLVARAYGKFDSLHEFMADV